MAEMWCGSNSACTKSVLKWRNGSTEPTVVFASASMRPRRIHRGRTPADTPGQPATGVAGVQDGGEGVRVVDKHSINPCSQGALTVRLDEFALVTVCADMDLA